MTHADPRLIEEPVRQSQSQIWKIQHNFFANMGIRAWKDEVPFYISSNAYIGNQYAHLVLKYIKDWMRLHDHQKQLTCYLLEVGSGPGKFSFYFLRAFKALLEENNLNQIKFCYIMSDFIEENLRFCQDNLSFKPYLDNNELDFACYNIENQTDFQLLRSQKKFSEIKSDLPLIVIANYTFDCIAQDEFEYKNGRFYEVRLGLKSRYKNYDVNKGMYLNELRFLQEKVEISVNNYYDNPHLNEILLNYPTYLKNKKSRISMPVGAIRFLDNLNTMTKQSYFLIIGDKGTSIPTRFPLYAEKYRYSFDGCYSFSVNFHAIGEYLKKTGGDYLLTENSNDFKVNLYSMGFKFLDLTETKAYFKETIEFIGPEEYCYVFDEFTTNSYRFSLKSLFAFLRFSRWDPNAYGIIHDQVLELLPTAKAQFTEDMKDDMNKIISNLYRINIGEDIFNLAGMFFQIQEENDKALELYQQSLEVFGDKPAPHSNIGLIYEDQKNIPKAIYHFQKAVSLDKNNRFAKKKLYRLTGKPYLALIAPVLKGILVLVVIFGALYFISRK